MALSWKTCITHPATGWIIRVKLSDLVVGYLSLSFTFLFPSVLEEFLPPSTMMLVGVSGEAENSSDLVKWADVSNFW